MNYVPDQILMPRIVIIALTALMLLPPALRAQQQDSGVVEIFIEEPMGMLEGFRVLSGGRNALTDSTGRAQLTLPVGPQTISVRRIGFKTAQVPAVIVRDSIVSLRVPVVMTEMSMELEAVRISATRTERLAGETPIRVEVVDEMEVEENTLMSPSGIGMLLNETPGLRVQATAPGLGTGSVRILGLPGQYTVMLADGLPLYGGSASALGPLDISPVDLSRVEIIKGAASSLYGGQALGGVINLVAKPPTGKKEVLLNRRTLDVTDAATWLSHRLSPNSGISLLASGTIQGDEDIDRDGWIDQPRANRWSVRPRFNTVDSRGRSVFVTAGYGYDNRNGGTLDDAIAPDGIRFGEGLKSNRADIGATAEIPLKDAGEIATRFALSTNWRAREFGPGPLEHDRTSTGFLEVTRSFVKDSATTVVGTALQIDDFNNDLNGAFDRRWFTPALFATAERPLGPVTISASVRGDAHEEAGAQLTQRLAVLAKPGDGWSVRASAGTGFAPPTATTEETEAVGLRAVRRITKLRAEKSFGAMLDVSGEVAGAELLVTTYASDIRDAIQMKDLEDSAGAATLQNAGKSTRIGGVEALAVWRFSEGKFIASYGFARGSRPDAMTGRREAMPLLPRHRIGGDLMLERPGVYRAGIEGIWYGAQSLDDNPFRRKSKPYTYIMALVARQLGPLEVVANFENLLNVRQTDTDPLVRSAPGSAGRWTTDVWAPLEGFMANLALRYRWG
jgi:outer membrane receptor for ferrienterochelin and colicins